MSKIWREIADPARHRDFMSSRVEGGLPIEASRDNLIEKWVYLAEVDGFVFQLSSLVQVRECRDYFTLKIRPSGRDPDHNRNEHYWQPWHARLPKGMLSEKARAKVLQAMDAILQRWECAPDG
ncbi:MAG: hypothetical protein R3B94_09285 [Hyphomonas sp.]